MVVCCKLCCAFLFRAGCLLGMFNLYAVIGLPVLWPHSAKMTAAFLRPGQQPPIVKAHGKRAKTSVRRKACLLFDDDCLDGKLEGKSRKL